MDRLSLLSQVDAGTRFALDRTMALTAKVLDSKITIEEIGEIASPIGPVSLWSGHFVDP